MSDNFFYWWNWMDITIKLILGVIESGQNSILSGDDWCGFISQERQSALYISQEDSLPILLYFSGRQSAHFIIFLRKIVCPFYFILRKTVCPFYYIFQERQSAHQLLPAPQTQVQQVPGVHLTAPVRVALTCVSLNTISMSFRKLLYKIKIKYINSTKKECFLPKT